MGIASLAAGIAKIQGKWRPRALLFLQTDQETWKLRGSGAERAPSKRLNAASKLTQRKLRTTNRHTLRIHMVSPRFGGLPVFVSWGFQWRLCQCWCSQGSQWPLGLGPWVTEGTEHSMSLFLISLFLWGLAGSSPICWRRKMSPRQHPICVICDMI